jgi:hypothetical protein
MAQMMNGDPEGRGLLMFCLGALVSAVVVAIVFVAESAFPWGEDEPSQGSFVSTGRSTGTELTADTESTANTEPASDLDRCQDVYDAQSEPIRAAEVALDQWEVHIGAMNKLVVGAITLQQARQYWNQTRVGAARDLERFATAAERYHERTARCPSPDGSADVTSELSDCHRAVVARDRALRLATVALGTWEEHVHHMEMLRRGEMTPTEATQLWLQSWQQGDREVRDYRAAARAAEGQTCP